MDTSVWVQTCYLEFVFGLASILLAAIFMLFTKNYRQGLPWGWLFLFGFLNGTGFWVGIAAQHLPLSYLTVTASFFKVMALLALVEFARAGTGQIRRRGPGLWLSGLVLFVSLTLVILFRDWVVLVQSALGFAGALWSALVFWWAAKREEITSQKRLLQVTSVTMAAFSSTYLVGPQLITGTALVSLMAMSIIHYLRTAQLNCYQQFSLSKHGKNKAWFLVMVFVAILGWFAVNYVVSFIVNQMQFDEKGWSLVILSPLSIVEVFAFLTIVGILLLCLLTLAFWVSTKRVMDSAMEIAINKMSEGQSLIKQRNYYQSLLDNLPIPLWQTNAEGGLIWINQTGLKFVGLSMEEMLGQGLTRIVHPDDRAEALSAFWRHFNERLFGRFEFRVLRFDGQYRWIVFLGGPYLDQDGNHCGSMGIFYDVTEKKLTDEKAQEIHRKISDERNQLFSVLESVPIAIYVTDAEHKIYFANRKFRETHGQSRAGKCYEIIHNREEPCLNCPASKVLETGIPEKIEFLWTGDLVYDVYYHPFTGTNGTPLVLELMIDITEQKNIQAILRKAKDEAEAASRSKSLFLANMSHEIRTPMNGILGMTELALDTDLNSEQRDYLNMVQASAKSLLRVINDILDFSKIEAGRMNLDVVPFKIRDIINQTTESISVLAEDQKLSLKRNVANDVPDILFGDPDRLRQVLFNLMGNAVKFTEKGEVAVKVNLVSRSNDEQTCVLKFSISDSGMGIPKEKLHRLFHRFSQVDESLTRKHGGTGLGLAISKQIVEMMGGAIGVESELGTGSTFYFTAFFGAAKGADEMTDD